MIKAIMYILLIIVAGFVIYHTVPEVQYFFDSLFISGGFTTVSYE